MGELEVTCPDAVKAFERGARTFTAAPGRDIVLAGRQFNLLLDPTYDCTRPGTVVGAQ